MNSQHFQVRWPVRTLLLLTICSWCTLAHAQPGKNIELPPPHEKIQSRFDYDPFAQRGKTDLTPPRTWQMVDGAVVQGNLIRWSDGSDVVLIQEGNQVHRVPRRRFDEAAGAEVDKLLGSHPKLMAHLFSLPVTPAPANIQLAKVEGLADPAVLEVTDDWLYWVAGGTFVRTPISYYAPADLEKIKRITQLVNQPTWNLILPDVSLCGELLGYVKYAGDRTAFVFRAFNHPRGFRFNGQQIIVPREYLADDDQQRAMEQLKTKKLDKPIDRAAAPKAWWPIVTEVSPAGEPVSIQGVLLTFRVPQIAPDADGLMSGQPTAFPEMKANLGVQSPLAWRLSQELVEEKRLRAEDANISDEKLAAAMNQFTNKVIASDPLLFLSPALAPSVREEGMMRNAGRLIAERGDDWIFEVDGGDSKMQYAIAKSELKPGYVIYGQRVLKQLNAFFAAHPEIKPPVAETKNRLVRLRSSALIGEPKAVDDAFFELSTPVPGGSTQQKLPLQAVHYKDIEEARVLLGSAEAKGSAPNTTSNAPMDKASRDKALATSELQTSLKRMSSWLISSDQNDLANPPMILTAGALQGLYQDSLVLENQGVQFLVDPDILGPKYRETAEQQLKALANLRRRAGVEPQYKLSDPPLRFYGMHQSSAVVASHVKLDDEGVTYRDLQSQTQSLIGPNLPDHLRFEFELQQQLDEQLRTKAPSVLSAEDEKKVQQLKQRLRAVKQEKVAEALSEKNFDNFKMIDCNILLTARFIKFDGDDALFKTNSGDLARVFKLAFEPQSLELMTEQAEDPEQQKKVAKYVAIDPAEFKMRVLRMSKGGIFLPSEPVGVDAENVLVRMKAGLMNIPIKNVYARDVSELRASLYRRKNGVARDTTIDSKLKEPIRKQDIVLLPAKLQDAWKQRADKILEPRQLVWKSAKLPIADTEQVLTFSPDATRILVAPTSVALEADGAAAAQTVDLKIIELANGKTQLLKGHYLAGTRAYLMLDNRQVVLFAPGKLKVVDLASSKVTWETAEIKQLPLASCQSGDGENIVVLQPDSSLCVVSLKHRLVAQLPSNNLPLHAKRKVWSSYAGEHVAMLMGNDLRSYLRSKSKTISEDDDESTRQSKFAEHRAHVSQAIGMNRPIVALGTSMVTVSNKNTPACFVIDPAENVPTPQALTTGLNLVWLGTRRTSPNNQFTLQIVGQRGDPLAKVAGYFFSAHISQSASVRHTTQTIEAPLDKDNVFAEAGSAVAYQKDGQWWLATEGAVANPVMQPLASMADELVAAGALQQIEAVWTYLRTKPFQEAGSYPDEAADTFLQLVKNETNEYGWQHGGDLDARADTLLSRWARLSPESLIVPTMQAIRERDLAWRARGDGFAATVTEAGAAEFRERMQKAIEYLKPVLKNQEPPTRAYSLAYDAAMSLGLSLEVTKSLNHNMMQTMVKYSPSAHAAVVLLLLPRWHGNPGDSEQYIIATADKLGGPTGDAMYAQLILFMEKFYPSAEPLSENVEYDAERLVRGLQAYYKQAHSAEYLQQALRALAKEEKWELVRELVKLQTEARIYVDDLSSSLKAREAEAMKAFEGVQVK